LFFFSTWKSPWADRTRIWKRNLIQPV
jgi:hypothetical protein